MDLLLLNCNSKRPRQSTIAKLLSKFSLLCLIDVKLPSDLPSSIYTYTARSSTTASHSISFVSNSINIDQVLTPILTPYCAAITLPTLRILLLYLPPSLSLTKVKEICDKIIKFQQKDSLPCILMGDLNVHHPENITSIPAKLKPRADFLQRFLRASHMLPLGVQTEKRCVDWICSSASALHFVQDVQPFTGSILGSLATSDHAAWCLTLMPVLRKTTPHLSFITQKATKEQVKDFGNYLNLVSSQYSLPADLDMAWLFLKNFMLIAASLALPCKLSSNKDSKKWNSIVSALHQSFLHFPNPETEKTFLAAVHHSKGIPSTMHSQIWDHVMSTLPLQTANSVSRTISRVYRSMRPTARKLPPTAELAKVFFSQAKHPTPLYTPDYSKLPSPLALTRDKIKRILKRLPNGTAPGPDTITYELLKVNTKAMASYLLPLYAACSNQLCTPQEWSIANVLPLYKGKGKHNEPGSYRPISLLPTCRKVFELLLAEELYKHSTKFHPSQFGFVPHLSLEYAVLLSHDHQVQEGLPSVLFDIAKAFDTVDRNLLWRKLSKFSSPELTQLVRSLFLEPKACILHPTGQSILYSVPNGVVQGSVLGPILFAVFINDFPELSPGCLITLFADDIRISSASIETDVQKVVAYLLKNHLQVSVPKTHALIAEITLGNEVLRPVNSATYLGFPFVPEGLDSRAHLKMRLNLARQALHKLLAVTPPTTSLPRILLLLKQFVFPVLEFGLPLLQLSKSDYTKLDKFAVYCLYSMAPDLPPSPYRHAVLGAFRLLPYSIRVLHLKTRLFLRLHKCWNPLIQYWLSAHHTNPHSCWRLILGDPEVQDFARFIKESTDPSTAYTMYHCQLWQRYIGVHTPFLLHVNPYFHNLVEVVDKPLLPLLIPPVPLNSVLDSYELSNLSYLLPQNDPTLYRLVKKLQQ